LLRNAWLEHRITGKNAVSQEELPLMFTDPAVAVLPMMQHEQRMIYKMALVATSSPNSRV